jgi:hypothetical protein
MLAGLPFQYYFIALGMIIGFAVFSRKGTPLYLRLFPFFLLVTFITEVIGWKMSLKGMNNAALYNFFSVAAFIYYAYVIKQAIYSRRAKQIFKLVMIGYTIVSLFNILFIQKIRGFHTWTYSIGCFLIVVGSVYYFLQLFQYPRFIDLKRQPAFWINSGLLFFYTCTLPVLGAINYVFTFPDTIMGSIIQLIMILNVFLYSLFTIASLCRIIFKRPTS